MSRRFVASLRDTLFKSSWAVSVVSVTFLHALWLSFGVSVSASSQDIAVSEGDSITLNCTLNGSNISWTTPTSNVPRFGHRNLSILSINRNESGVYNCSNSAGVEKHNVTVQYGAEGRISGNETEFNCGETLNITCKVEAVPWVTEVAWFSGGNKPEFIRKGKEVVLSIRNVNSSDSGTYICCPKNRIGNAQNGTTNITVKGCAPTGVNSSTNGIKTYSVSTTGTINDKRLPLLIALGVALGFLLVVVMIGVYLCLRRRRLQCCCKAYFNGFFSVQGDPNPSPRRRPSLISVSKIKRGEIPVDEFAQHVKFLHTDGDYRFNQEFEGVKNVHVKCRTWLHSDKVENQAKNRYGNIVAYDHSRVILSLTESEPDSHYINANFVDSFEKGNAYIATQGPLPNTVNDFWRMVWEQNCTVVVMITNIIEKGRHKCVMYWPSKQVKSEVHGPLRITYLDEEAFAFYTVRRFEVKPVDQSSHYSQAKVTMATKASFQNIKYFSCFLACERRRISGCRFSPPEKLLGSFSSDDGDGNENVI